jgi:rod shape-determining protein MreC
VILALLLTAALLLAIDLNGTTMFDRVRDGFSRVMSPIEDAAEVVTEPVQRAWRAIAEYDDLQRENEALQDQVDRLIGTQASAQASVLEYQELRALFNLPSLSGIDTEVAQVIGRSPSNFDQIVEINKGRNANVAVGMPVVNQAGLVGRVTSVTDETAKVMLITDARYTVAVEIVAGTGEEMEPTRNTSPSGRTNSELRDLASTTTTTDAVPESENGDGQNADTETDTDTTLPDASSVTTVPGTTAPPTTVPEPETTSATSTTTTTTTTVPELVEKEFGALGGRGSERLPQVRFLQDNPSLAVLAVGDLVETAGGSESLAPPNIPVGRVVNRADRPGVAGPLLEVEPHADLSKLNFVRVVLYRPLSEVAE